LQENNRIYYLLSQISQVLSSLGFSRNLKPSRFSSGISSSLQFCDKFCNMCKSYWCMMHFSILRVFVLFMFKCTEMAMQEVCNPSRPRLQKCHLQFEVSKKINSFIGCVFLLCAYWWIWFAWVGSSSSGKTKVGINGMCFYWLMPFVWSPRSSFTFLRIFF